MTATTTIDANLVHFHPSPRGQLCYVIAATMAFAPGVMILATPFLHAVVKALTANLYGLWNGVGVGFMFAACWTVALLSYLIGRRHNRNWAHPATIRIQLSRGI